ncbi:hypothetical protein ACK1X7_07255 [Streptomyces sp. CY1]|uniref:hypothetical protein n=1 Tax=Streptomyces sp. CY1 TaxID=3388313 RepID=UPI0039A2629D
MASGDSSTDEEPPLTPEEEEELPQDQQAVAAPQLERRPPYAVAYSAGGHAYELLLSGDASVTAEDGVLKILHDGGPVLGIIRVMPVRAEGTNGADPDNR